LLVVCPAPSQTSTQPPPSSQPHPRSPNLHHPLLEGSGQDPPPAIYPGSPESTQQAGQHPWLALQVVVGQGQRKPSLQQGTLGWATKPSRLFNLSSSSILACLWLCCFLFVPIVCTHLETTSRFLHSSVRNLSRLPTYLGTHPSIRAHVGEVWERCDCEHCNPMPTYL
jgi:hypothetical protein